MAFLNSKNSNVIYLNNRMLTFFLGEITQGAEYNFYDDEECSSLKYSLSISSSIGNRCLQFRTFNTAAYIPTICPYVIYAPDDTSGDILFETNFISAQSSPHNTVMCTFWSTLQKGKTAKKSNGGDKEDYAKFGKYDNGSHLQYDPTYIEKIVSNSINDFKVEGERNSIFCSTQIIIQPLYTQGDDGEISLQDVAVINKKPMVLQQITSSDYYMFDVSLGGNGSGGSGSGSGLAQHNHIPHLDGSGFAFAVFHPGTSMPQLPWN